MPLTMTFLLGLPAGLNTSRPSVSLRCSPDLCADMTVICRVGSLCASPYLISSDRSAPDPPSVESNLCHLMPRPGTSNAPCTGRIVANRGEPSWSSATCMLSTDAMAPPNPGQ